MPLVFKIQDPLYTIMSVSSLAPLYPLYSFYNFRILGSDGHNPYAFENISEVIIDPETGEASEVVVYVMDDSEETEFTGAGAGIVAIVFLFLYRRIRDHP